MDEVLQKLNLDHFIENFKEQKISGYRVQIVITRSGNSGHHEQTRFYVAQNCVFGIRRKKSNKTKGTKHPLSSHCRAPKFFIQNLSFNLG